MNTWAYIYLFILFIFGNMLFIYAFPNLSVQQSVAAVLSICSFSFGTSIFIKFGLKDKYNKK